MQRCSRRAVVQLAIGLVSVGLAGCFGDGDQRDPASPTGSTASPPTTRATGTDAPPTTSEPTGGAHGETYPVQLWVVATPVETPSELDAPVPTLAEADVSASERRLLRAVIERGETDHWSGSSNEVPPAQLRDLIAAVDRLAPSRASRDPDEAWRVARQATAYVRYENETYRLEMVKVAP